MAMNMVFSSAELANAGDSSSQLKTDGQVLDRETRHYIRVECVSGI
jgi:hypothetical protein